MPALSITDAIALVVGIVVGAGIFRSPSAVAGSVSSGTEMILAWIVGGVVSLAGAMCYAELATMFPTPGGDYHYIGRALGRAPAFLFGWARLTVIPTGSLALLGFTFGDYAASALGLPAPASAWFAAAMIVALTALNVSGLNPARGTQNLLTAIEVAAILGIVACGFLVDPAPAAAPAAPAGGGGGLALALVFVLLMYGGWNDGAYVSAEVRGGRRAIATVLLGSIAIVTALYVLANLAYLRGLGPAGMAASTAVAADLLSRAIGPAGPPLIAAVVAVSAITSANATLLMGSRMAFALGRDTPIFSPLGRWSGRGAPVNALVAQGAIALLLVAFGATSRSGFEAMVAYTAPVFWLFFLLAGASLLVLRRREPNAIRPFRVPLYPLTPLVFCAACLYLLWSSVRYAGPGAIAGLLVLATGVVPLWLSTRRAAQRRPAVA
ncbi:MAG TPA: amino acid permease [Anaeromyxobacteraceae bacterium]|nr:amino acid permease [Anaeromyxobacteraceae bacterium]